MDMRGIELREPFLQQTVERVQRERPDVLQRFTDLEVLVQFEKVVIGLPPAGFIFHSSRCGSTVVSNALKALDNTLVVSEPYAVDKLIGRFFTDTQGNRTRELLYSIFVRAAVNALGQRRRGGEQYYVIKFSSISTLQMGRINRIWPDVPIVFVYRRPTEVIYSNLVNEPDWMKVDIHSEMAEALLEEDRAAVKSMLREEFCARVVGKFYQAALEGLDGNARLLNYDELTPDSILDLAGFFGVEMLSGAREAVLSSMLKYAKDAGGVNSFLPDSEQKRALASVVVKEMAARWADGPYERLEVRRNSKVLGGD
jgi:hypothetical protein